MDMFESSHSPATLANIDDCTKPDDVIVTGYEVAAGAATWGTVAKKLAQYLAARDAMLFMVGNRPGSSQMLGMSRPLDHRKVELYLSEGRKLALRPPAPGSRADANILLASFRDDGD